MGYWRRNEVPLSVYLRGGAGTAFMHVFTYPFVYALNLSFFTGSVLFSFIGFLGVLYFYLAASRLVKHNTKVAGYTLLPWIFFLPNIHFWSAGVGKDTLSFFCVGLFLYSSLKPMIRAPGILLSLFLVYNVRPHMAIFLLLAFGLGIFLDKRLNTIYKFLLTLCFAAGAVMLFDDVMEYVKLDEVSTESLEEFSSTKQSQLSRGHTGSSVDISSYPLPLKVFTFLFRPLFIDAHNIASLLASVENLILLFLTYVLFKSKPVNSFKEAPFQVKGLILFVLIGAVAFSNILGNMGIMIRMKNMFTPALLIFIIWVLSYQKGLKTTEGETVKETIPRRKLRLVGPKMD